MKPAWSVSHLYINTIIKYSVYLCICVHVYTCVCVCVKEEAHQAKSLRLMKS